MDTEQTSPNMEPERPWPAVLTEPILKDYLGCRECSATTLKRRIKLLQEFGLGDKDEGLQGWVREEVDLALRRKRGLLSPAPPIPHPTIERDDSAALVEAAKGTSHEGDD